MSLYIHEITIKNFRSIRKLTIKPGRLAILAGQNDSGKSNILRAIHLFFNGNTQPEEPFLFEREHNVHNKPTKRAKEIEITLQLTLPKSYHETNGEYILWKKVWRRGGLYSHDYCGLKIVTGPRGGKTPKKIDIPQKSNVHSLLRKIRFTYVPAIRDHDYFSRLREQIYDVIAEVAEPSIRKSSANFEATIAKEMKKLTDKIDSTLRIDSRLALPRDLAHIFESLDFLSKKDNISLEARGDGIKTRHIPLILKFMTERMEGLRTSGAPPHSFIWAYEEPENCLEFSSAMEMAEQFRTFLTSGISQIILTTHSPVFYNLTRSASSSTSCHHVYQEDGTSKISAEIDKLDERLGTLALIAPEIEKLQEQIHQRERALEDLKSLGLHGNPKIFVEGESDRIVIEKALSVFASEHAGKIDVVTKKKGAGTGYVHDMLLAWHSQAKHDPKIPRAAGLLDNDEEGNKAKRDWNSRCGKDPCRHAKCFVLDTPSHLHKAKDEGYALPIDLESLYDPDAWKHAEDKGYLKKRSDTLGILPEKIKEELVSSKKTLRDFLAGKPYQPYVEKCFLQEGKHPMAEYHADMSDSDFRKRMPSLEKTIKEIIKYLTSKKP